MIGGKCGIDTKGWWFVFAVYICLLSKHIQFNFHEYIHERVTRCLLFLPCRLIFISPRKPDSFLRIASFEQFIY